MVNHKRSEHYTLGLLLSLYFAQGLPAGFLTQALPAILRQYHVSLEMIGWTGLLLLPNAVKFLWAPAVDHHYSQKIGQSRSWILPSALIAILILTAIALFDPTSLVQTQSVVILFSLLFVLNIVGATQDIATDGLAVRMLGSKTRSAGNAVQVTGYRLGLIIGGGVLLIVIDYASWSFVFFTMIGLIAMNTLPVLFFKEPVWIDKTIQPSDSTPAPTAHLSGQTGSRWIHFFQKIQRQFGYFWSNTEMRAWLLVLLVFKIADYMSSGMVKPMMVDMGFSLSKIGFWGTIIGSLSSLVGAILAAWLMRYMRRATALVVFNGLQAITTGLYALIAWLYTHHYALQGWELFAVNAIEHIASAMAMVGLLTVAMDYARSQHAGSDFTFQVCAMTVLGGLGYVASGYLASSLGYAAQFGLSALLGLILLLPILRWGQYFRQTHTVL